MTNSFNLANLEVKSKAPNGVNYTVKGKSAHEGPLTGSVSLRNQSFLWIYQTLIHLSHSSRANTQTKQPVHTFALSAL